MQQPLKELIQQSYMLGLSFSRWDPVTGSFGEITHWTIPEGNVFLGLANGWYRMYLDSKPLCLVKVSKPFSVTVKLYSDAPRTEWADLVEEPISWEYVEAGAIIRLVTACNKGKKALPYWKVATLPQEINGYVGTPNKEKTSKVKKKEESL